jgi:hypothetical protein
MAVGNALQQALEVGERLDVVELSGCQKRTPLDGVHISSSVPIDTAATVRPCRAPISTSPTAARAFNAEEVLHFDRW